MKIHLKIEIHKHPFKINKELFKATGALSLPKMSWYNIMMRLETCSKLIVFSPIKLNHLIKCVTSTKQCIKVGFQKVLFTDR